MKARTRAIGSSAAGIIVASAVVFSPLVATLLRSSPATDGIGATVRGLGAPLWHSVGAALVSGAVALFLGAPFALLVDRARRRLRRVLWTLGLLVLMVPPYVVAQGWIVLLGPAGKISKPLTLLAGFGPRSSNPVEIARYVVPGFVYSWPAVGVVMGGCFFTIVALAAAAALRRTDHRVYESARMCQGSAGVRRILARVLVPPSLGAALLVLAATLTEFAVPQLLRVRTAGEAVYERIQEGDLPEAGRLSLPLLPLVVAAGALGAFVLLRSRSASLAGLEGEVPKFDPPPRGGPADIVAALAASLAVIPALVLPMTALLWLTVTARLPQASASGGHRVLRASGFADSLSGAWELAHNDALRTVWLAALVACGAIAFAIVLARATSRTGWGPALGILGAGLAVPAPVVALGLILLWNHPSSEFIYGSLAIVALAWLARFLPLGIFLVQGALARVPRELESAAALAGRGPFERFLKVILPGAAPGLAAAWLATYILSATEFGATLLVAPPGSPLLAPSVINLMRRGQDPEIAACQFLLLAVVGLPLAALALAVLIRSRTRVASKRSA